MSFYVANVLIEHERIVRIGHVGPWSIGHQIFFGVVFLPEFVLGTLNQPIWTAHQEVSTALYVVSGCALPVLVIGLVMALFVGNRTGSGGGVRS